jgi:hypothetical protein
MAFGGALADCPQFSQLADAVAAFRERNRS